MTADQALRHKQSMAGPKHSLTLCSIVTADQALRSKQSMAGPKQNREGVTADATADSPCFPVDTTGGHTAECGRGRHTAECGRGRRAVVALQVPEKAQSLPAVRRVSMASLLTASLLLLLLLHVAIAEDAPSHS